MADNKKPWEKDYSKPVINKKPWEKEYASSDVKKKVASKPRSQEELWGSDSQPQDLYTSLVTGAQEPQQESDGLGGPPSPPVKKKPSVLFPETPMGRPAASVMYEAKQPVIVESTPFEAKPKKYYRIVSDEKKAVEQQISDLEQRNARLGRTPESLTTEGTYQALQKQKAQLDQEFEPAQTAIKQVQRQAWKLLDPSLERLVYGATDGKYSYFTTDIINLNKDVEDKIIDRFDDAPEETKVKWYKGGLPVEAKEAIINSAKNEVLNDKYNVLKNDADNYIKNVKDNPSIPLEEKLKFQKEFKERSEGFNAQLALDYSGKLLKNNFKITDTNRNIDEAIPNSKYEGFIPDQLDNLSTFTEGMAQVVAKVRTFIPSFVLMGAEKFNQLTGISRPEDYTPIEATMDLINDTTNLNFLPSSQTKRGNIVVDGEWNPSLYSAGKTIAKTLPFTLKIMSDVKKGRLEGTPQSMIAQLINPKYSKDFADKLRVVETAYKGTLADNYRDAKDMGMDDSKAFLYANVLSLAEGVSENIIPDYKYFDSLTGASLKAAFKGGLKQAVTKQAAKNVTKDFFKNIAFELGEEEVVLATEDALKYSLLLNHKNSEFFNMGRQKELVATTALLSGTLGTFSANKKFKQNKTDLYNTIHNNIYDLQDAFLDEIDSPLNDQKAKEALITAYKFANDVSAAVSNAPENVTADQIDLLVQKKNLEEKKKNIDTAFHPDINEEIAGIDAKIRELAKMPAVEESIDAEKNKEYLGTPTISTIEDGDLYEFKTQDGIIGGVMISPTEFRIDGISANEVGKGQGSKMFEALIENLKTKGVTTLTTKSAGEGAVKMHNKAVDKGLLTKVKEDGRTATFSINSEIEIPAAPAVEEVATTEVAVKPVEVDNRPISERQAEAESKIKRKDLFTGVGDFSSELGGSDTPAVPVSHREVNGIELVEYAHPKTGSVDVIVTGKSDNDFVGFYRIYENGKPTNKWSSKFENQSRNKEDFKTMISGVQSLLPEEHEYTEKTSISTDGLRVWGQQLERGYELQTDENGNIVTNEVAINGDAIVNELGIDVNQGNFDNISVTNNKQFQSVKKSLLPYLQKFGLNESNIRNVNGTVEIDLPVLKKSTKKAAAAEVTEPKTKAEQYSEELDKTKESDPEAYWSVSPVSAEDAAKGTIIDTPDGAAIVKPDGDIAGLFKKATSKAKGVAQDLLKRAIAAGGKKLDNYDTYLTPQYIKAGFRVVSRTPFNEKYAPPGWNKEKHGTPDVVAMIYDPEGKLDIEEKTFNDPDTGYDEAIAYRDSLLEIEAELEGLAKLFDESDKGFRMSQVDNAKEALKGILPGVEFIVHETTEAYNKATDGGNSGGTYIYRPAREGVPASRVIHINKQKANGRTVAHEVFHAVILDKIKGDKKVQEITARMVDAVYKTASPELRAELDAFAARYTDKTIRDEERLAELLGIIADGYPKMSQINKGIVKRWLEALAKMFGRKPFTDNEVIDLLNTLAVKVSTGEVISEKDVDMFNEEGAGGFAGVFKISRQQKGIEAPKSKDDSRSFIRDLVEDIDIREFNGKKFITNMYDYTNAGETDLGNGFKINLFGGKGYVPYMMELNNKKIGDVSNLAAFNTQAQAETFIRNAEKSGAELFAPHSGTKDQSWQFQQHTFAELVNVVLDKGILTNKELIDTFNNSIKGSKALKETFSKFSERYGKKIKDFSSFKSDPKKIVDLLDIKNNLSPDLRKALNNSIASNKKFQEAIGIKNKEQFYNRIMDPLNNGVTGGEIMGVVKFDPNTFKIVETKPDAIDHHPSFGYTLLAKINGIYQPTEFHKSYDVTDSYTKYNTNETKVSIKSEDIKFNEKNVTSSAGAIPKVAEFKIKRSQLTDDKYVHPGFDAALEASGETEESITEWEKKNAVKQQQKRTPKVQEAAEKYFNEEISQEELLDTVKKEMPIKSFTKVPAIPTFKDLIGALDKDKVAKGIVGLTKKIADGVRVASRLDIPAYERFDKWVVSVHDGIKDGLAIAYGQTAVLKNVDFSSFPGIALNIARGKVTSKGTVTAKTPMARIFGDWVNEDPQSVHDRAIKLMNDPEWVQVGMNPFRHSWFYDKADGMPIKSAEEVIQVGALVLAKKPVKVSPDDPIFNTKSAKGNNIRFQQAKSIDEIVRIAKEAKYSDAAISSFLKAKGFSDAQIASALSTDRPSVNKIYEDSKKAIEDKKKRTSIKDLAPFLRKSILDRQTYIKKVINRIDNKSAKKAYDLLVTKAGASALAAERFKRAEKKIYGGLNADDTSTLDKIIYAKRMVSVNESRAKLGLEPYKGMDGYSIDDANKDLADFKNSLGDKKFNDLSNRATEYFDVFKLNLKKLYESGRISKETYESLKDTEYSPIKTIKYIIGDNLSVDEIDTQAKSLGISRNDIMKLSDSNENEIIMDSKWLLAMSINSVEGRAFENNMLREFDKAIKNATPEEKKAFEDIILDNPVVGTKKDGGLKYKYDDTRLPVGFTKVSYFNDGNKVEMILKDQYAKQLLDVKDKNKALETLGKLTGTKILRFFATGGNPLFIIGNTAVDFQNIAFFSDVYSKFKPIATVQLARDYTKNFVKKLVTSNEYNTIFNEYLNHGGALDYMASDGLRSLESMNPVKGVTKAVQKGLIAYGRAMSLLGETSEAAFRLSVFQKVKEDSIKEFKKENNREPNEQELDDIMWDAARQSRETMPFDQGGDIAKKVDAVFPYFNAALQGIRRPIDFAKRDPVGFSSSVLQYTVMASSLAAGSFAMLISAVGGDDDEEKAKNIMEALNSLSEYEKANYHIMFTGEKNKDGEYKYYRIKKLPVLSVISTVAEQLIYKAFFKSKGIEYDMDSKVMLEAVSKSNPLPVTVMEVAAKNPIASGLISYAFNTDTFTGDKIFREPDNKKILPEAEGMFDDRVDQIYKDLAPGFGLSPARTKVMVEKVITSANTNPTIPLIYSAYDGLFNKNDGLGSEVKEAMSNVGDAFGKKVVRYTDKKIIRYKDQDEREYQESLIETKVWNSEQKVYNEIKKKYDGGGSLTNKELIDLVKENFEPMDYMKYAKKYNTYIHNMNIDKSVLDIIFEDVPEVQAMKLNQRYGPNLEEEELKELGKAMNSAGKRVNNKSIYIYNKKYKNRKNAQ